MGISSRMRGRLAHVHRHAICAHGYDELEVVIDHMLRIPKEMPGDIIECGVYAGGSTAKLSIVAKHLGRRLVACDSFKGLPAIKTRDKKHVWCWGDSIQESGYVKGQFAMKLLEVKKIVGKLGEPSVVDYVPGWFKDTLPGLRRQAAFVILDVDLIDSIETCVKYLWPYLAHGAYFFTHEAIHDLTVALFKNRRWWADNIGAKPPAFYSNHPKARRFMPEQFTGYGYSIKGAV